MECDIEIIRSEMRSKRERKSKFRGQTRTEIARPKEIERDIQSGAGNRLGLVGRASEISLQLQNVLRKSVAAAPEIAAQGASGALVAARGAAQPEVDPPRVKRFERAELLGDHERRVVR